jgi:hypothetical protein
MMIRRASLVLAATLALAACGGDEQPAGVIPREKFVAVNVALRSMPDAATPAERAAVLRKHGVTERQLKAWVAGNTRNPATLAKAWEEIAFKLDSGANPPVGPASQPSPPAPGSPVPPPPGAQVPPARPQGMADSLRVVPTPPPPPPAVVGEQRAQYPGRPRQRQ